MRAKWFAYLRRLDWQFLACLCLLLFLMAPLLKTGYIGDDNGNSYRARVSELVHAGRAFAWIEDGHVVFKAEIGAVTADACQIQGVWTHPALRGRGIAAGGMAAVVEFALRDFASVVSLYVNDYNAPARAVYRRVGFEEVGAFASVLF